jgi:hypothetical protein
MVAGVENRHGRHRHADRAVGVDGHQAETEFQLGRTGLIRRCGQDAQFARRRGQRPVVRRYPVDQASTSRF